MDHELVPDCFHPPLTEFKLLIPVDGEPESLTEQGSFTGYLARYGNLDFNGDIIQHGAFAASLAEFAAEGNSPPMLLNHAGLPHRQPGPAEQLPIGIWTSLSEDQNGMRVTGRLDPMDTDLGKQIYAALRNRTISGLSVGYIAHEFKRGTKSGEPKRLITRAQLIEGSIVGNPANAKATVDNVKSLRSGGDGDLLEMAERFKQNFLAAFAQTGFDPGNMRQVEILARDVVGCSRKEAKEVTFQLKSPPLNPTRDASGQEVENAVAGLMSAFAAARS